MNSEEMNEVVTRLNNLETTVNGFLANGVRNHGIGHNLYKLEVRIDKLEKIVKEICQMCIEQNEDMKKMLDEKVPQKDN